MSSIFTDGKIGIGLLCVGVFFCCAFSSYGASPQQHPEQFPTLVVTEPANASSPTNQPAVETPSAKELKKKAPKEGVKKVHRGKPGKNLPSGRSSIHQPHNPVDLITGQELLPMPDEPKR